MQDAVVQDAGVDDAALTAGDLEAALAGWAPDPVAVTETLDPEPGRPAARRARPARRTAR